MYAAARALLALCPLPVLPFELILQYVRDPVRQTGCKGVMNMSEDVHKPSSQATATPEPLCLLFECVNTNFDAISNT